MESYSLVIATDHNELEWSVDKDLIMDKLSSLDSRRIIGSMFLAQFYLEDLNTQLLSNWRDLGTGNTASEEMDFDQVKEELFDSKNFHYSDADKQIILSKFFSAGLLSAPSINTELYPLDFEEVLENEKVFVLKGVNLFQNYSTLGRNTVSLTIETIHHIIMRRYGCELGIQSLHKHLRRLMQNRCENDSSILHNFVGECQPAFQLEAEPLVREKYYFLHQESYQALHTNTTFITQLHQITKVDLLGEWRIKTESRYKHKAQLLFKPVLIESQANKLKNLIHQYLVEQHIIIDKKLLTQNQFQTISSLLEGWETKYQWVEKFIRNNHAASNQLELLARLDFARPTDSEWLVALNRMIILSYYFDLIDNILVEILPKSLMLIKIPKWENAIQTLDNNPYLIDTLYSIASQIEIYLHHYTDSKIKQLNYQLEQENVN